MTAESKRIYWIGAIFFFASGFFFITRCILEFMAGPPPAMGDELLAWVQSSRLQLAFVSETFFTAVCCLIPATFALYVSLADVERVKAAIGCGIIAAMIPVMVILLIVHGRLVFPIYGIKADTPAVVALLIAMYYGGLHVVALMFAGATLILSLAMRRGAYGRTILCLGIAATAFDIAAGYPDAIGPVATLVAQGFFVAWFVGVGFRLLSLARGAPLLNE